VVKPSTLGWSLGTVAIHGTFILSHDCLCLQLPRFSGEARVYGAQAETCKLVTECTLVPTVVRPRVAVSSTARGPRIGVGEELPKIFAAYLTCILSATPGFSQWGASKGQTAHFPPKPHVLGFSEFGEVSQCDCGCAAPVDCPFLWTRPCSIDT